MSDTPITNECIKENKHIKFLEEDHWSLNGKFTYTHPIVSLCRKLERERDMYERQVTCLLERLGKTQELMIDAERGKQNSNKREFTLPYINTNQND